MVDKAQPAQQKKRIHQIILNNKTQRTKRSIEQPEEILPYEIEPVQKFRQTMAGGFRTSRPTKNTSRYSKEPSDRKRGDSFEERFKSVEVSRDERLGLMNRTFMGKMPQAYNPRWENES